MPFFLFVPYIYAASAVLAPFYAVAAIGASLASVVVAVGASLASAASAVAAILVMPFQCAGLVGGVVGSVMTWMLGKGFLRMTAEEPASLPPLPESSATG